MKLTNKNPLIICVCGKARCGKNFVSEIIYNECNKNNLKVIISPYTKYLKKYISEITNWDMTDKDKPRDLLQKLSSELIKGKLKNKDFFIRRQLEDIEFYSYFFDVIIIPDVRFSKEIEVLKEKYNNVISIGIVRENYDNGLNKEQQNDITETSLDNYKNYDYFIKNNGDDSLYEETLNIFNNLRKRENNE